MLFKNQFFVILSHVGESNLIGSGKKYFFELFVRSKDMQLLLHR